MHVFWFPFVKNHALLRTFQIPQNVRVRTFLAFFQLWDKLEFDNRLLAVRLIKFAPTSQGQILLREYPSSNSETAAMFHRNA